MSSFAMSRHRPSFLAAMLVPVLALLLACGPGEEPTPAPTPTQPAVVASPTPTRPAVVASPTPTTVAPPSPTPTPGVQPQRGGTMKWASNEYMPNFEPYLSPIVFANRWVAKLHNNLLVKYVDKPECEVCSEWHLENQGNTMVFTLIPGIKFQDGREMTSADVKYSLRMMMGEVDGIVSGRAGFIKEYIRSIDTPSKYELRLNLFHPSIFLATALTLEFMMIIPDGTTRAAMNTKAYGSGPFIVKRAVSGASWSLERNANYFKPGLPYLDGFEIVTIAEEATRMASVMTGSTDYAIPAGAPPPQYRPTFYKLAKEGTVYLPTQGAYGAWSGLFLNNSKPPFDNLKIRQAANLAVDRKILGEIMYGEFATPAFFSLAEGTPYGMPASEYWDKIPGWGTGTKKQQEIEQAKQLVIDAGYPKGLDTNMMFAGQITANSPHEALQQMVGVVGIRAPFRVVTPGERIAQLASGDYQAVSYGLATPTMDPEEIVGNYFIPGGARDFFHYSNPVVDRLYFDMARELDPVKRRDLWFQIRDIVIVKDVVFVPLQATQTMQVFRARVQGFTGFIGSPHAGSGFQRADRLWVKQ